MLPSSESPWLSPEPPLPAAFSWGRGVVWLPACAILGALVAGASVVAQEYFAPLLLYPLLVGVGVGAMTAGMSRVAQVGHRGTIACGLLLAIVVTVVGQHYIHYRMDGCKAQRDAETFRKAQQLFPNLTHGEAPVSPRSFLEYLRWQAARGRALHVANYVARGAVAWLTWAVDGMLVLLAAVAVALPAIRQPYCNQCRSWYRTVRSGRIPIDLGREIATLVGATLPAKPDWVRYRLLTCDSGCGPAELMLFWQDSQGNYGDARSWLNALGRGRVTELLDQVNDREQASSPNNGTGSDGNESSSSSASEAPPA